MKKHSALICAMDMKKIILDLLFPRHCLGCNREETFLCEDCFCKISVNRFDQSKIDRSYEYVDVVYAVSSFDNLILHKLIHCYKYNFIYDLHLDLGELIIKYLDQSDLGKYNLDFVVPVPLSRKRMLWRGFNQTQPLAKITSDKLEIKLKSNFLIRILNNRPQVGLSAKQRLINAKNVYQGYGSISGKNILLIDDITTTGATLEECAKELKQLGVHRVIGLVVAQG